MNDGLNCVYCGGPVDDSYQYRTVCAFAHGLNKRTFIQRFMRWQRTDEIGCYGMVG